MASTVYEREMSVAAIFFLISPQKAEWNSDGYGIVYGQLNLKSGCNRSE